MPPYTENPLYTRRLAVAKQITPLLKEFDELTEKLSTEGKRALFEASVRAAQQTTPEYYSHAFKCFNCNHRFIREIKRGILAATATANADCPRCGCRSILP